MENRKATLVYGRDVYDINLNNIEVSNQKDEYGTRRSEIEISGIVTSISSSLGHVTETKVGTLDGRCQELNINKEEDMSLVSKIKNLTKSADTKLLEQYNIIREDGLLTSDGEEVVVQHLFEKYKAEIVEQVKNIDKESKKNA